MQRGREKKSRSPQDPSILVARGWALLERKRERREKTRSKGLPNVWYATFLLYRESRPYGIEEHDGEREKKVEGRNRKACRARERKRERRKKRGLWGMAGRGGREAKRPLFHSAF